MKMSRVAERSDSLNVILIDNIDVPVSPFNRVMEFNYPLQTAFSSNALTSKNYELFEVNAVSIFMQYSSNNVQKVIKDAYLSTRVTFKDNVEGAGFLSLNSKLGDLSSLDLSKSPILLRNVDGIKMETSTRLYIPPVGVVYNSLVDEIQEYYPDDAIGLYDAFMCLYGKWIDIGGL